ncbi:prenyltransferase/squalene oxidase repeat-containing protein [Gimesia fumaroli]|uniref:A-macroglobulin complement component n=1 Tax=Gimesia fumaroli TaxID=2527976 RepID=A0A518I7P5_9PLAN|nr:prenyltransferase/squalene oxidase repeat-containing protein [Gimesia fumaroli]QDV49118.1 A-macroglobulin complement component [Gimesia fumaroli]
MLAFSSLLLMVSAGALPEDQVTTTQVRETVQRSIPYIEEKGLWWIEKKKCVSCHRGGNMVWSLHAAKQHGFEVSDQLQEWTDWSTDKSLSKNDKGKTVGLGNKEGVVQILLSSGHSSIAPDQKETRQKLAALLLDGQQPDGSWKAGGQLPFQKRPAAETNTVSTMWLALTLIREGNEKSAPVVEKAMQFINASPPGKSTEWYAVRLLLAVQAKDSEVRDQMLKQLHSLQKPDGGWGWMVADESDALGTGMALYALLEAGVNREDASIKQAQQFLVSTQRKDGSWPVKGTKEKKKASVQETAIYWGTCWAVISLVESLPQ